MSTSLFATRSPRSAASEVRTRFTPTEAAKTLQLRSRADASFQEGAAADDHGDRYGEVSVQFSLVLAALV